MSQKNSLTWSITGCSTGFGRELTKVVLARGYRAVVTDVDVVVVQRGALEPLAHPACRSDTRRSDSGSRCQWSRC